MGKGGVRKKRELQWVASKFDSVQHEVAFRTQGVGRLSKASTPPRMVNECCILNYGPFAAQRCIQRSIKCFCFQHQQVTRASVVKNACVNTFPKHNMFWLAGNHDA